MAIGSLERKFQKKFDPLPYSVTFLDKAEVSTAGNATAPDLLVKQPGVENFLNTDIVAVKKQPAKINSGKWIPYVVVGGVILLGSLAFYFIRKAKKEREQQ